MPVVLYSSSENQNNVSYGIKNNFDSETKNALFITSNYSGEHAYLFERKFRIFKDIVVSHWNVDVTMISQDEYFYGMSDSYEIIFYIKEENEAVPRALYSDILNAKDKNIILSGYNDLIVDKVLGSFIPTRIEKLSEIYYKEVKFSDQNLNLLYDTNYLLNLEEAPTFFGFGVSSQEKDIYPFAFAFNNNKIVGKDSGSDFFVFPFLIPDLYAISNYSIIFLDLLYEGFGIDDEMEIKPALIRLEDVNVNTYFNPNKLSRVYNILDKNDIPFHIAFIVKYVNPEEDIEMLPTDGRRFYNLLRQMIGGGKGVLVQHGYTHQIGDSVSGIGFEFWDEDKNTPLDYESKIFVIDRIKRAQDEMRNADLPVPDIWETPHYTRSSMADEIFNEYYPIRYEHINNVGSLPFTAKIDGTIYIPENMGFIDDDTEGFLFGQSVEDLRDNFGYLSVFRNPTASLFWHPWRKLWEIEEIIRLLEEEGYTFISAYDLLEIHEKSEAKAIVAGIQKNYSSPVSYLVINVFIFLVYFFFVMGCLFYIRTIFRLKHYAKVFDKFDMGIDELEDFLVARGRKFPFFTIFVPARNEALVIGNTIRSLAALDYPKFAYEVAIIVDERELKDDVEAFTKDVAEKVGKEINTHFGEKLINVIEVPDWYSGVYNDFTKNPQKSTKGRALNFALQKIQFEKKWRRSDMICVLDADGRLHPNVLKEAAYNRALKNSEVLQGPVLQISNFDKVSLVGIAAGIELAIHHLTELPNNLIASKRVQFLAGTNYFIDKDLIHKVSGWDQNALVEDAELALRIFIKKGVKAGWIGSPEIEQTPENFSIYKKQRSRWVRGHLDLIKDIKKSPIPLRDKLSFYWKIFVSQFRFVLDLGFPVLAITFLFLGLFVDLGKVVAILSIVLLLFATFMWDLYGGIYRRISPYINLEMKIRQKLLMSMKLFLFMPVFMFVQSIPRVLALVGFIRSAPVQWYKTERTRENGVI